MLSQTEIKAFSRTLYICLIHKHTEYKSAPKREKVIFNAVRFHYGITYFSTIDKELALIDANKFVVPSIIQ